MAVDVKENFEHVQLQANGWGRVVENPLETVPLPAVSEEGQSDDSNWYNAFKNRRRLDAERYEWATPEYQPEPERVEVPRRVVLQQRAIAPHKQHVLAIEKEWIGLTGRPNYSEYYGDLGDGHYIPQEARRLRDIDKALLRHAWQETTDWPPVESVSRSLARLVHIDPDEGFGYTLFFHANRLRRKIRDGFRKKSDNRSYADVQVRLRLQQQMLEGLNTSDTTVLPKS